MRVRLVLAALCLTSSIIFASIGWAASSTISTYAGGGPDGVPALAVNLSFDDVIVDGAGNIYFSSPLESRVFMVDTAGTLRVAYGTGIAASMGDGGPAADASFYLPGALAIDGGGSLLVHEGADYDYTTEPPWGIYRASLRVRRIDPVSQAITTIAGGGGGGQVIAPVPPVGAPLGLPSDLLSVPGGDLFLAGYLLTAFNLDVEAFVNRIAAASGLLVPVPNADVSYHYSRLEIAPSGQLLFTDTFAHRIRSVDPATGMTGVFAGTGQPGSGGDGGPAIDARLTPGAMARNAAGDIYVSDTARLRRIDAADGTIHTVAGTGSEGFDGDGGPATLATISTPLRVAVDGAENQYMAGGGRIRRIDASNGLIHTVAGNPDASFIGNGGPATQARLSHPIDLALTPSGDVLIADGDFTSIHKVDHATGRLDTLMQLSTYHTNNIPETLGGVAAHPDGSAFYVTYATFNGDITDFYGASTVYRIDPVTGDRVHVAGIGLGNSYSGDGGPALQANLNRPQAIAFDSGGNLFIADTDNHRVRRVDAATGIITTIAGDGTADPDPGDGGPATQASLVRPLGIAFSASGDLYIADSGHFRVRRVRAADGLIETVAGNGTAGSAGDGGPATLASIYAVDVALDALGNLFFSGGASDNRVRRVDAASRTITTVAGNGSFGISGDGGHPALAALADPRGVLVDADGRLFIATWAAGRVRLVTPPPSIRVAASPALLWPPAHDLIDVTLTSIPSAEFVPDRVELIAATSNEPDDAPGGSDGRTTGDIQADIGSADLHVRVRAERDARGSGRVYALTVRATSNDGTEALGTAYVTVPHDGPGQTDPLQLTVTQTPEGTLLAWDPVEGALSYDVVRGSLGAVTPTPDAVDLGALVCVEQSSIDITTAGHEESGIPPAGSAWFYLVSYEDARGDVSYGTAEADLPLSATNGGCRR